MGGWRAFIRGHELKQRMRLATAIGAGRYDNQPTDAAMNLFAHLTLACERVATFNHHAIHKMIANLLFTGVLCKGRYSYNM